MASPRPVHHLALGDGASLRLDVLDGQPTASAAPDPHAPSYDRSSARYEPDDTEDDGGHDGPGECADVRDELALLLGAPIRREPDDDGPGALDGALDRALDEHGHVRPTFAAGCVPAPPASQPSFRGYSIGERRYQARLHRPLTDLELGGRIELFDPDDELED